MDKRTRSNPMALLRILKEEWFDSYYDHHATPIKHHPFFFKKITAGELRKKFKVVFSTEGTEDDTTNIPNNTRVLGIVLCSDDTFGGIFIAAVCQNHGKKKRVPILKNKQTMKHEPEFDSGREECQNWNANKILFTRIDDWYWKLWP